MIVVWNPIRLLAPASVLQGPSTRQWEPDCQSFHPCPPCHGRVVCGFFPGLASQGRLLLRRQNPWRPRLRRRRTGRHRLESPAPFSASRPGAAHAVPPAFSLPAVAPRLTPWGGNPGQVSLARSSPAGASAVITTTASPFEGSSERLTCAYALSCAETLRCPCPSDSWYDTAYLSVCH